MPTRNYSIVVPVFNEVESLQELHGQIVEALPPEGDHEVLYIDDGSDDGSITELRKLADADARVKVLIFFSNYGKAAALSAGFSASSGDIIATLDSDLQDNPMEIPAMVALLDEGWDMVSGWKKVRHDPISKRWPSKLFNLVARLMTGVKIHDFNCGLKVYRAEVAKSLDVYGGLHRYIPAMAKYRGFKVTEKVVEHRARKFGKTKYGITRYFHGLLDLFTILFLGRYFQRPLHFFGLLGLTSGLAGFGISAYLAVNWFRGVWIGSRPLLFLGMLLIIVGIQFFSLGLLAEIFVQHRHKDARMIRSIYSQSGETTPTA